MATWLVFGQTTKFDFVDYDDTENVSENPHIIAGLNWRGIEWAFTHTQVGRWTPLTTISRLADCQLWHLHPGGHHATNVLLHAAAAVLLFLVLKEMTAAFWRSAFVAALLAIHPLRTEAVAWISARGDLLCAVFFMLTLWAYIRYAQKSRAPGLYGCMLLFFTAGLMSQPMLVTLPFLLLLLDYWPLHRLQLETPQNFRSLIIEKIPLFALSVAAGIVAVIAQRNTFGSDENFPLAYRVGNALISCVIYIRQMIWPAGLAALYPRPVGNPPLLVTMAAGLLIAAISFLAFRCRNKRPWFAVGWLWYLGMLVPVIGLFHVFSFVHADRYTDLPQIGLSMLIAWAVVEFTAGSRHRVKILSIAATMTLVACACLAYTQTSSWKNNETLWAHTLACTESNGIAENGFANALLEKDQVDEAIAHYRKAIEIKPDFQQAHINLGNAFFRKGDIDTSIACYQKALALDPNLAKAHLNLSAALLQKGAVDDAIAHGEKAVELDPDSSNSHETLGKALLQKGRGEDAVAQFRKAIELNPASATACFNLGNALFQKGLLDEAAAQYQRALEINPGYAEAAYNLGNVFLQRGQPEEAIIRYRRALEIKPDYLEARNNIGFTLLKQGRADEALAQYEKEIEITPGYAPAYYNRAIALLQAHRPAAEAIESFRRALEIKPDYLEACYSLAHTLAASGRADEATPFYQKAFTLATEQGIAPMRQAIQSEMNPSGSAPR